MTIQQNRSNTNYGQCPSISSSHRDVPIFAVVHEVLSDCGEVVRAAAIYYPDFALHSPQNQTIMADYQDGVDLANTDQIFSATRGLSSQLLALLRNMAHLAPVEIQIPPITSPTLVVLLQE